MNLYASIKSKLSGPYLVPILALAIMAPIAASAVSISSATSANAWTAPTAVCVTPARNLAYGSNGSDVSSLQGFLSAQGDLQVNATGYFGALTLRAVEAFQSRNGVPATGFVGALTRTAWQKNCGTTSTPPITAGVHVNSITPSSGPVGATVTISGSGFTNDNIIHFGGGAIAHVAASPAVFNCPNIPVGSTVACGGYAQNLTFTIPSSIGPYCAPGVACPAYAQLITPGTYNVYVQNDNGVSNAVTFTVTAGTPTNAGPVINSIAPTAGVVGTAVTIYGSGFTNNDAVLIGNGAIQNTSVSQNGTQMTFIVPQSVGPYCTPGMMCAMYLQLLSPGTYQVSVKDESTGMTSNAVSFTVSGSNAGGSLSVTGLDAPTELTMEQSGTWAVHASYPSGSGSLHYSVVWGDEAGSASIAAPQTSGNTQTSATFTHMYLHPGTYTPTFTVTDDAGHSATASATVIIHPIY